MDPITIALITAAAAGSTGGIAWAIAALRKRAARRRALKQMSEEERLAFLEAERKREEERRLEKQRRQEAEHAAWLLRQEEARRERERLEHLREYNLAGTIARIGSQIEFAARRIKVGVRKVDQRAVGIHREEVPFPAEEVDIRPLKDLGELHQALPSETALDDDLFYARAAAGELLVAVNVEVQPIHEDVFEDVWEERQRTLMVVLDVSPSVFEGYNPWMPPVWKGLTLSMIDKSQQAEASVVLHEFDKGDRGWYTATAKAGYTRLRNHIAEVGPGDGTDIGRAILRAIDRLEKETFDQAQIMLVTDGADYGGVDPQLVRQRLDTARIKLHVVLLGVEHQSLLSCADTYQIVENTNEGPVVRDRITRQ